MEISAEEFIENYLIKGISPPPCNIKGDIEIKSFEVLSPFRINEVEFNDTVRIIDIEKKEADYGLIFNKCIFHKSLDIRNANLPLIFNRCTTTFLTISDSSISDLYFDNCNLGDYTGLSVLNTNTIRFQHNKCNGQIFILRVHSNYISLDSFDGRPIINLEGISAPEYIANVIRVLDITLTPKHSGSVTLRHNNVTNLWMSGYAKDINISFSDLTATFIKLRNLVNTGFLKVNDFTVSDSIETVLDINDVHLGNCSLNNMNLKKFKSIKINNSNIEGIIPSNVHWCDKILSKENTHSPSELREIYRQLKNVTQKSNDKPQELKFHSLEMDNYLKQIKKTGSLDEKIILYTNRFSNKHGLSWIRAFVILLLVNIIYYTWAKFLLGQTKFDSTLILKDVRNCLELINPFDRFSGTLGDVLEVKNDWLKFIDIFRRIATAYLIYQFLRAFRRFAKN